MTRAELTEEVYQAIEMPRKESDVVVAPYLMASSVPCDLATRLKSADLEASTRAKDEHASDAIQKLEPESKCHRREFPSSNRARNFANWLRESEQDGVCSAGPRVSGTNRKESGPAQKCWSKTALEIFGAIFSCDRSRGHRQRLHSSHRRKQPPRQVALASINLN